MIGQTIAHYRITEKLGEGGMGEVYRAHDTKLNRDVALKILPEVFAQDRERMIRFEREAQVLASLNHSNIAQIYGLETRDARPETGAPSHCLVLELVEGETLQEQITRGPFPVDEALKIALQICEGLEAAHEKGIIHRDLKPANIKVTPEGQVKILDFGLAKALEGETPVSDLSHSPTLTEEMTRAGVILGTASYMSPEQARGKPVDKRTDIWAFGCVLYEMLTGKKAFGGDAADETVSDVLAAVLRAEPDLSVLPADTPDSVVRLLRRCLAKDFSLRLQSIGDARIEILETEVHPSRLDSTIPARKKPFLSWSITALSLILAALMTILWLGRSHEPTIRPPILADLNLPTDAPMAPSGIMPFGIGRPCLALSPTGRVLVYVALRGSQTQLFQLDLISRTVAPIAGTEGADTPVFSPDGHWIAFVSRGKLRKVALSGGVPTPLADVSALHYGLTWDRDNWIYYISNLRQGTWRVAADGSSVEPYSELQSSMIVDAWPEHLPGGLLFSDTMWGGIFGAKSSPEKETRVLVERASFPRYVATGHLVFATQGRLAAVAFDPEELEITGTPVTLIDDLRTEVGGAAQFTLSSEGTLIYASGEDGQVGEFVWVDREGKRESLGLRRRSYGTYKFSPSESSLAFVLFEEWRQNLLVYDFQTGIERPLSSEGIILNAVWSADERILASGHQTLMELETVLQPLDGSWDPIQLSPGFWPAFFLSDKELVVSKPGEAIGMVSIGGEVASSEVEIIEEGTIVFPALSPDGKWLVYADMSSGVAQERGFWEIYVSPWPSLDGHRQISKGGGEAPRWNPNGKEIVYRSVQPSVPVTGSDRWGSQWMSVELEFEPELKASSPAVLFDGPYVNAPGYSWDISADGERFLLVENAEHQAQPITELKIVTNFFDLLREKVPTDN